MPTITVKSKVDSFRRAGLVFTRAGVELDAYELTLDQLYAIASEPQLTFLVDGEALDRPSVEQLAEMRAEIERRAAEKAEAEKAAAKEAAAEKVAAAKDKKADKTSAK